MRDLSIIFAWVLILLLSLSGCNFVSYEDVSSKPPYSDYIGKHYRSNEITHIYRISMERNYKPDPSVYIVYAPPGIEGPEVLSKADLPVNTTFEVLKVMRCVDCYLDSGERVHVVAKFTSTNAFNDREVQISKELIGSSFIEMR
jgi:hypothetical protein